MSLKYIASETLAVLDSGFYQTPTGRRVDISEPQKQAVDGTRLLRPADLKSLMDSPNRQAALGETSFSVTNERTQTAARRIVQDEGVDDLVVLNFASARNPGGGFLNGAKAQEEDLARASGVFKCLETQPIYYEANMDPKDWRMLCKERSKWRLHPLDKATVKAGDAQLEVKNTTGIHSSAYLVFNREPKGIDGDFQMIVQLKGGRQFGLRRRPGEYDGALSIPIVADKWQTITMTRRGREVECTLDGKNIAYGKRAMHEYMAGLPFVLLNTDEVVTIRRFHVINRIIDENYFHKCPKWVAVGKTLKYQPGFDKPLSACELVSGPKGMTVSKDGQLTWTPSAKDLGWHTVKVRLEIEGFPLTQSTSLKVVSKGGAGVSPW